MVVLNENDIINIMNGSALLASGGGGAVKDGLDLLDTFKKNHPNTAIEVKMIDPKEMEAEKYAAVVAGIGAPTKGANQDFSLCASGSFDEIRKMASLKGQDIQYTIPVEMGGFNTFAPMLISLAEGREIVDCDLAGRAVPGLETLLTNVNGFETSPVAMSDGYDNRIQIAAKDPMDAEFVQSIAGIIADKFNANAGIAGWVLNREQIDAGIPAGTITAAWKIGKLLESAVKAKTADDDYMEDVFEAINRAGIAEAKSIAGPVKIRDYKLNSTDEFDMGDYFVGDDYHIYFQNENLVLCKVEADGRETPYMTAPDIITMYDAKTGASITNEDLDQLYNAGKLYDMDIVLGIIKVDNKWWVTDGAAQKVWKPYFESVGYDGDIIRFEETGAF